MPAANLVGQENGGWTLVTNQLNHERVALTSAAPIMLALDAAADGRRPPGADGARVIDRNGCS